MMLLTGCTYADREPGLFPPANTSSTTRASEPPRLPPSKSNPALPVAGEAIWTTAEGLGITVRFAIHAVRRIDGATVLDWSVTPLQAAKLRNGDLLPGWLDLGLTRQTEGDANVVLLDGRGRAYRPLSHVSRAQFNRCLCSPLWASQSALQLGETRMLQLTFPGLPSTVTHVDVGLANVATFWHVPVSPVGRAPVASHATDLGRAPESVEPAASPYVFASRGSKEAEQSIQIRRIVASPNSTSVEWTLRTLSDRASLSVVAYGPPVAATRPDGVLIVSRESASGPQIRPSGGIGPTLSAQWMTAEVQGRGFYECLCTSIGLWAASLRQRGGAATVTTTFPALPPATRHVDVTLPGLTTLRDLRVVQAPDAAAQIGKSVPHPVKLWTYLVEAPPRGWSTYDWPTPTPDPIQLRSYNFFVERIVPQPGA
jgi:hypothetical protein